MVCILFSETTQEAGTISWHDFQMRNLSLREWRHFQGHTASWWQAHCIQLFQSPESGSEILSTALVHVTVTWGGLVEATESHSQRFWFWSGKSEMRLRSLHIKSSPLQVILTRMVCGSHFRSSTGSLQRLPGSALWPTAYFKDDSSNITHACMLLPCHNPARRWNLFLSCLTSTRPCICLNQ